MSLTARERYNPPPRRKSCAACTKARRRCDLAMPSCLRCTQRRIPCEYPSRDRNQQQCAPQADFLPGALVEDSMQSSELIEQLAQDMDSLTPMIIANSSMNDFSSGLFSMDDSTLNIDYQSTTLIPPSTRDLSYVEEIVSKKLQYAIDAIQKAPLSMVLETQTPWSHPFLYRDHMPRSIQDAHSCCALYTLKNRANAPVILRSIESRVQDLLASPDPVTPLDCLAHTHALILYQIIRLFDGNIGARVAAERNIPVLATSAMRLLSHVRFDTATAPIAELPLFPLGPTKAFWSDWVFQESARRTLLFTFFFLQAYHYCSGNTEPLCDERMRLCHSWTLSAHLWQAKTAAAFAEAWKNKKHFVVADAVFDEVIQEARADDVDDFGRILLSGCMGIEEAEAWFMMRGGSLRPPALPAEVVGSQTGMHTLPIQPAYQL